MTQPQTILIRPAAVADVPAIASLINDSAELGLMLPKPLAMLYENVRELHVATRGDQLVGVGGLSIIWADLAEVCSLVVDPSCRGRGLGRRLVEAAIEEARRLGVRRLMTLTYEQAFFERLGFSVVDRQSLPLKVWSECLRCPKNQACDEIAMVRVLEDVPQLSIPKADQEAPKPTLIPVLAKGQPVNDGVRRRAYPPVEDD
ncbi:N-acetyltransferase [Mucisphaera sp.]|uniref:N-acetyltransferase n=1 Tax=Mucisphaera sp. TaxID=2913024 RepID=UPI003D0F5F02